MTTKRNPKETLNSLRNYDFYSFPLEKKILEKWYIPAFGPYIIAKLLAIPLYLSPTPPFFLNLHEDMVYLSVPLALSLVVLLYREWAKQAPMALLKAKNYLMKPRAGKSIQKQYDEFLGGYMDELHSPLRYVVIVGLTLFMLRFLTQMLHPSLDLMDNAALFQINRFLPILSIIYYVVFYIISPLIWVYLVGVGIWVMSITGRYVWKLPRVFEIKVEPRHPDKCGGLSFLGAFCLSFSYPILVGTVFLGILGLTGGLAGLEVAEAISDGAALALIFVAMPLLYVAFFVPLLGIHKEMELRRKEFLEVGAKYIKQLEAKVNASIQKKNFTQAKQLSSELDSLVAYYSGDVPVWPLDKNTILKFMSPQIVPVLGILFKLETLTQDNLTTFIKYLFPSG